MTKFKRWLIISHGFNMDGRAASVLPVLSLSSKCNNKELVAQVDSYKVFRLVPLILNLSKAYRII